MNQQPKLTSKDEVPPAVKKLCERIHAVAEELPTLVFIPNADHSVLYPMVVVRQNANSQAKQINAYLLGENKATTPVPEKLRQKYDLTLEAIHAAADYLPVIVFLPSLSNLYPVNLVPESVAEHLKPCYQAIQEAQKSTIGIHPIAVVNA